MKYAFICVFVFVCMCVCMSRYTSTRMLIYKSVLARNKSQPPIQIRARTNTHDYISNAYIFRICTLDIFGIC